MKTFTDVALDDVIKQDKKKDKGSKKNNGKFQSRRGRGQNRGRGRGKGRGRGRRIQKGRRGSERKGPFRRYRDEYDDRDYESRSWKRRGREIRRSSGRRRPERLREPVEVRRPARRQEAPNKLFVDNLPMKFTSDELNELFSEIGYLTKCKLVLDDFGKSKGRAVVAYENIRDAERAIEKFNENKLDGKIIYVEFAPGRGRDSANRNRYNGHDSRIERAEPRGERDETWRSSKRTSRR